MKWLNETDKANISQCLIKAIVANMASTLAAENVAHTDTQAGLLRKPTHLEFSVLADNDSEVDDANAEQDHFAIVQAEQAAFRARKSEPLGSDPLIFWKQHSASYPNLALQAAKLLCIPATSLPCERLFSVAGVIVEKWRTALNPDQVQNILCLNSWLK